MTSLLPSVGRTREQEPVGATSSSGDAGRPVGRPLTPVAALGGASAAATTLVGCLAAGVVGWFLVDSGAHGTSGDGLRVGALGWLLAHGSGLTVLGAPVTLVPLGLTLLVAVVTWRIAVRTGEAVAWHGPDADRLGDGERDWTVPLAGAVFVASYVVVATLVVVLAASPATGPGTARALLGAGLLAAAVGVPGIAVGSGRAAVWAARLPASVPATLAAARTALVGLVLTSLLLVLVAALVGADDVANVFSLLHTSPAEAVTLVVVTLALLPNAVAYGSAWLLGPGFAVGTQTVVSPSLVVLGPLPMFPLLGALPGGGDPPSWLLGTLALPPLVVAAAVVRAARRHPTARWEQGALRGCGAGLLAAVVLALLGWLAGGALGPARMSELGPAPLAVLLHAVPALGLGGLVGGLVATWLRRRSTA